MIPPDDSPAPDPFDHYPHDDPAPVPTDRHADTRSHDWQSWWERETALTMGSGVGGGHDDPFAARRAEPRLFAFFWTVYLLAAVLGAVWWLARSPTGGPSAFSPAARTMLVIIAVGVVILWPMTRLSQLAPPRPVVRATALDLVVMLGPAQLVIWPLVFLADWPVPVVAALCAQLAGWGALIGGVVALALVRRSQTGGLARGTLRPGLAWMILIVAMVSAVPLGVRILSHLTGVSPAFAGAFAPFDFGGSMLGQGFSGPTTSPGAPRWVGIGVLWAISCVLWAFAVINETVGNRTERARFV